MKRKVVQQGASTLMISLPTKWVKKNNISKGDELEVEETNYEIVVKAKHIDQLQKRTINVKGLNPLVNRILIAEYIKGTDELEVVYENLDEVKDFMRRVINELIGFEIIKQGKNNLLVKDITGYKQSDIIEVIKRVFFVLDSMAEELTEVKEQEFEQIVEIDASVNKFCNFSLRLLNKGGYPEHKKTAQIYAIISLLEEVGDLYKKIARIVVEKKGKISSEQRETLKKIRGQLSLIKQEIFEQKTENLVNLAKNYEKIKKQIKNKNQIDFCLHSLNETIITMNNHLLVISIF